MDEDRLQAVERPGEARVVGLRRLELAPQRQVRTRFGFGQQPEQALRRALLVFGDRQPAGLVVDRDVSDIDLDDIVG